VAWLFDEDQKAGAATWGEWMGAWKAEAGEVDVEADRLSRAHAAFGGETLARMKDLNVLIIGCRGVGVETAKNLILSNVGSVTVWDPDTAQIQDLGANFYLSQEDVGKPRALQCLPQLKSLNPYCKVDLLDSAESALPSKLSDSNVLSTGRGYSAVVVTRLLPQATLFSLNAEARTKSIAFILAVNMRNESNS
jgi:ubiquitin-activating enzyme E1